MIGLEPSELGQLQLSNSLPKPIQNDWFGAVGSSSRIPYQNLFKMIGLEPWELGQLQLSNSLPKHIQNARFEAVGAWLAPALEFFT